jgi:antitoxin (DNA-binding transcriptional repressor) of toxin-antitoxin stability system
MSYREMVCSEHRSSRESSSRELRNDSSAYEVQGGQTITVTRTGTPIAELRPIPPRRFVPRVAIAEAALRAFYARVFAASRAVGRSAARVWPTC